MICSCGTIISCYRLVGVFDAASNNESVFNPSDNMFLAYGGSFYPVAMLKCNNCGKISFYSIESDVVQNLSNDISARNVANK